MAGFNGSGTFVRVHNWVTDKANTVKVTASRMDAEDDGFATGLSTVICKDGQTTTTAAIPFAVGINISDGSVGTPSLKFISDADSGFYRIGANNVGLSLGGSKVWDFGTATASAAGSLVLGGSLGVSSIAFGDGTVGAPAVSFSSDPDTGFYIIGANNVGLSVGGAKVWDFGTASASAAGSLSLGGTLAVTGAATLSSTLGVTGAFAVNTNKFTVSAASGNTAVAGDLAVTGGLTFGTITLPAAGLRNGDIINGAIAESRAGNAVTFALKTAAGTDPSATDPVLVLFRNVTVGTGTPSYISITSSLSLTISSGSTLGATSATAFKVWLVIFNDGGTVRLGAINTVSGTSIYPLGRVAIASSTTEGGAGGADSAQTFYSGTGVTSKAYVVLGYCSYESGLTTAGTWDAAPTRIQIYGDGVPLPGQEIQTAITQTGANSTGTTVMPQDDTIPLNDEGDEFMTRAITPTSAANILHVQAAANLVNSNGSTGGMTMALFQDAVATAQAAVMAILSVNSNSRHSLNHYKLAGTTSEATFKIRAGGPSAGTTGFNANTSNTRYLGGSLNSHLNVTELMT